LATEPKLLILDEPAAGLNDKETLELVEIISSFKNMGITILLIEHDMDMVMSITERIAVLNFGKKIAEGTPEEIQNNPDVIEAYLGSDEDE
jgi:branched-chain amino acid transport system ATP-binding protein